jgi:hypothetical protein
MCHGEDELSDGRATGTWMMGGATMVGWRRW